MLDHNRKNERILMISFLIWLARLKEDFVKGNLQNSVAMELFLSSSLSTGSLAKFDNIFHYTNYLVR